MIAVPTSILSFLLLSVSTTNAFSTVPMRTTTTSKLSFSTTASSARTSQLYMSDDQPSDTSSDYFDDDDDEVIVIDSEDFIPTVAESLVTSILDLLPALGELEESKRAEMNEALLKLESLNPTPSPALSPLLNGVWELRYAGLYTSDGAIGAFSPTRQLALFVYSGGYSPGLFALELAQKIPFVEIASLDISISREQPRVEGTVTINSPLMGESTVSVKSKLDVLSDVRLRETYESATVMGSTMELPEIAKYSRDIYVTYVDEDLLIIRDGSGVPELLVRKEKSFTKNWGVEPSSVDDVLAPGEEES